MSQLYSQDLYGSETYSETTTDATAGDGTYNEIYYNENVYNAAILVLALFEALTASDNRTLSDAQALAEALTLADNLQKIFNGAIFNETLTPTDIILNNVQLSKLDILTLADARVAAVLKILLETMTLSEVRTLIVNHPLGDVVVLLDVLTKFISDKRLNENLRFQDWLSVQKRPAENIWSA